MNMYFLANATVAEKTSSLNSVFTATYARYKTDQQSRLTSCWNWWMSCAVDMLLNYRLIPDFRLSFTTWCPWPSPTAAQVVTTVVHVSELIRRLITNVYRLYIVAESLSRVAEGGRWASMALVLHEQSDMWEPPLTRVCTIWVYYSGKNSILMIIHID